MLKKVNDYLVLFCLHFKYLYTTNKNTYSNESKIIKVTEDELRVSLHTSGFYITFLIINRKGSFLNLKYG